jgi:hypothetical protein
MYPMTQGENQMEMETEGAVPAYETPKVVDYGSLRELTAGQATGAHLDATFATGTDSSLLTFSTTIAR